MSKLITLTLVLVAIILGGCTFPGPKKPEIIYKDRVVLMTVPESLLQDCAITKPIATKDYVAMTADDKEDALVSYIEVLINDHHLCAVKVTDIAEHIQKLKKLYPDAVVR